MTPIRSLALLVITTLAMLTALALGGCSKPAEDPGAAAVPAPSSAPAQTSDDDKPITMYFVPSMEAGEVITSAEEIVAALEERTGYTFDVEVPTSYIAVVEAMGAEPARADIAWLSTFAYVLASDKYGAEIALQVGRYGELEYRGMFVTRKDSGIKSLEDIAGKTIAFVDPASTSGHIYPSAMLSDWGIEPAETVFAGGHPQAMLAVYSGRTDVGCAYYSPTSDEGEIRDARSDLLNEHFDAGEVLQIIEFTDWIPNDTVTFRRGFPRRRKPTGSFRLFWTTLPRQRARAALGELYNITELVPVEDAGYDSVREKLAALGIADESTLQALIERNELPSDEAAGESASESAAEPVEEEPGALALGQRRRANRRGSEKVYDDGTFALRMSIWRSPRVSSSSSSAYPGSGKSTLLRCINRLIDPTEGRITFEGDDVTAARGADLRRIRRRMGMVFQQFNLVPRSSVLRNVLAATGVSRCAALPLGALAPADGPDGPRLPRAGGNRR